MQVTYDDGEVKEELLPLERVSVSMMAEDLPAPDVDRLEALGAFLLLQAEEAEQRDMCAAGGTQRSRTVKGSSGLGEEEVQTQALSDDVVLRREI